MIFIEINLYGGIKMNNQFNESLIKSLKATVINSQKNNLSESDKKVLDALDKMGEFLKSYNKLNDLEKRYLSQIVIAAMTIIINAH